MSLQDILNKILDEAAVAVKQVEAETSNQKKALKKDSDQLLKQAETGLNEKTKTVLASLGSKTQALVHRESARLLLETKQALLEKALNELLESLSKASEKDYGAFLEKLFAPLKGKQGTILTPKERLDITQRLAPEGFSVEVSPEVKTGFVAQIGSARVDNTFENMIFSEYKPQLVHYFAENLKLL